MNVGYQMINITPKKQIFNPKSQTNLPSALFSYNELTKVPDKINVTKSGFNFS